jgi:hypothetical protein
MSACSSSIQKVRFDTYKVVSFIRDSFSFSATMLTLDDLHNKNYNCFPFVKELQIDTLNPISAYLKVTQGARHSFLFESVVNEKMGRYSFIGLNPRKVLILEGDPLTQVEQELAGIKQFPVDRLPDFTGGRISFRWCSWIHFL